MSDKTDISFKEAISMGEYDPKFLKNFPEWEKFSKHTQLQYIRKAMENRRHQLLEQWAEVYNTLDFSEKPHLLKIADKIKKQLDQLEEDRERLYMEFTG